MWQLSELDISIFSVTVPVCTCSVVRPTPTDTTSYIIHHPVFPHYISHCLLPLHLQLPSMLQPGFYGAALHPACLCTEGRLCCPPLLSPTTVLLQAKVLSPSSAAGHHVPRQYAHTYRDAADLQKQNAKQHSEPRP